MKNLFNSAAETMTRWKRSSASTLKLFGLVGVASALLNGCVAIPVDDVRYRHIPRAYSTTLGAPYVYESVYYIHPSRRGYLYEEFYDCRGLFCVYGGVRDHYVPGVRLRTGVVYLPSMKKEVHIYHYRDRASRHKYMLKRHGHGHPGGSHKDRDGSSYRRRSESHYRPGQPPGSGTGGTFHRKPRNYEESKRSPERPEDYPGRQEHRFQGPGGRN